MDGFSGVVRISNVNDYISPSAACIIPLKTSSAPVDGDTLVGTHSKKKGGDKPPVKVSISLADCLACAGCITSAETVLIEEQSLAAALAGLAGARLGVITVSPSSLASICTSRSLTMAEGAALITKYFLSQGAQLVLDANVVQLLALHECWQELAERLRGRERGDGHRPLIVSACPGFVCYAEKSHGRLLLPLMSRAKSLQGISGVLVKEHIPYLLASTANEYASITAKDVFHVSVMPCFDRKLEASRPENTTVEGGRDVDCVLGTAELNEALEAFIQSGSTVDDDRLADSNRLIDNLPKEITGFMRGDMVRISGNVSGGYAEYTAERWKEQVGGDDSTEELTQPNSNIDVLSVRSPRAERPFVAARVYGFRNIQNMVRKLKLKKEVEYDLVEVMACPSGCANGGAQIRQATTQERVKAAANVERLYSELTTHWTGIDSQPALVKFQSMTDANRLSMNLNDVSANTSNALSW